MKRTPPWNPAPTASPSARSKHSAAASAAAVFKEMLDGKIKYGYYGEIMRFGTNLKKVSVSYIYSSNSALTMRISIERGRHRHGIS